jgi:NTE family protein
MTAAGRTDAAADPAALAFGEICRRARVLRAELQRAMDIFVHGRAEPIGSGAERRTAGPDADGAGSNGDAAPAIAALDLELTAGGWRHLVPADPAPRRAVADLFVDRYGSELERCQRIVDILGLDVAVAGELDTTALEYVLRRVDLPGGATLFEQGEHGDSLYVITRGRLRVLLRDAAGETLVRELGPDQTVGELALLTGDVRTATVVAVRDTVVYRLDRDDFARCALTHPTVTHNMLATLAERLNRPPRRGRLTAAPRNIVVLPAGAGAPVREVAEALHTLMARYVSVAFVTAASVDEQVGPGAVDAEAVSPLGIRVHDHLSALEERYAHVIHVGEDPVSPWSARCARAADLILLVGRAGAPPALNELERRLLDPAHAVTQAKLHLVLVEAGGDGTPTATDAWLERRSVDMCHHVQLGSGEHFARLARFVVGSPVALVLSGGAARAFAHIGVLRAMRAAGIPIDIVAATSAGALIGGQLAMGWDPERIEQVDRELFGRARRKLIDLVPPFTSLIGSRHFNAALDEIFGDVRFEDLWIQFMCTTTDLTSAQGCTHRRGRLRPFVRASCSVPMVMPPVTYDGHLHADGGIMNNIPVEPLLEVSNVGALVVVNVTNPFYTADEAYNYEDTLGFGRILNGRFNPFAERLVAPGIFDVLMRSLEIGSKSLEPAQIAKADVYIRPDVSRFGYTNMAAMGEIIAAGEEEATAQLAGFDVSKVPFSSAHHA